MLKERVSKRKRLDLLNDRRTSLPDAVNRLRFSFDVSTRQLSAATCENVEITNCRKASGFHSKKKNAAMDILVAI